MDDISIKRVKLKNTLERMYEEK